MSISIIERSEAQNLINDSLGSMPTYPNFHDIFGTNGCLLCCEDRKRQQELPTQFAHGTSKERRIARGKSKAIEKALYKRENKNFFTLHELADSASNGCGSCKILRLILTVAFPNNGHNGSALAKQEYFYSVSYFFLLCEVRSIGDSATSRKIQLFHPQGYSCKLQEMNSASFLSGNTDSDLSMERLSNWLHTCTTSHQDCSRSSDNYLPSRLIDVTHIEENGIHGVKLIDTVQGQTAPYVCLSHCWGKKGPEMLTTRETLAAFKKFINFNSLSRNFRDAILITRKLKIQFIWIDSLCIIQKDKTDWEIESSQMARIYRNAYMTIAAVWAPDSTGGCFSTTTPDICLSLDGSIGRSLLVGARMCDTIGVLEDAEKIESRLPLFTRGWVFQERLMSRRILYCNYGEFSFQCLERVACECGSPYLAPHMSPRVFSRSMLKNAHRRQMSTIAGMITGNRFDLWREMVMDYMTLNLTFQNDILPAMSGCATVISGVTGDEYIAGMWKRTLSQDLCWYNNTGEYRKPQSRGREWTAPSWSWASVPPGQTIHFLGLVKAPHEPGINFIKNSITHAHCEPDGKNQLGCLKSGYLELEAPLFPCYIRQFCTKKQSSIGKLRRRKYDIHTPRPGYRNLCNAEGTQLDPRDATIGFLPDRYLGSEELKFNTIPACNDVLEPRCALAPVYLLHLMKKWVADNCTDYFMVLKDVGGSASTNTYARIGFMTLGQHKTAQRDRWFEEVWGKSVLSKVEFTMV